MIPSFSLLPILLPSPNHGFFLSALPNPVPWCLNQSLWRFPARSSQLVLSRSCEVLLLLLHYNHTQRFSTMEYFLSPLIPEAKPLKFCKSGSLSSVRTQVASHSKTDLIPRKISDQQKLRLINLITVQNYNMKEAAKIIQISYSTAKKIFTRFKKALRLKTQKREDNSQGRRRCGLMEIEGQAAFGDKKVGVVSTVAGRVQSRTESLIQS